MAQPSANREPTMEEILASIRRIIESNDTGEFDVASPDPAPEMEAEIDTDSVLDDLTASNDDDDLSEYEAEDVAMPLAAAGGGGAVRPVSLADVAARVRSSGSAAVLSKGAPASVAALSTRGSAAVHFEPDFAFAENEADDGDAAGAAASAAQKAERQHADVDFDLDELSADLDGDEPQPGAEATPDSGPARSAERGADRSSGETREEKSDTVCADPAESESEAGAQGGNHLMSPHTGAKVAAAFSDLNEMIAEGPHRSFDEIAEEMLRPMLQQWLDDNLPTLVERLVREEIERVARGGSRR